MTVPAADRTVPFHSSVGDGTVLVLMLHGVGGGHRAFAGQMEPLARAGWCAVAWDMPGYGASPMVEPYTMPALADACIALIDGLLDDASARRRVVLVGHSMGGMVAQEVLARAPGRMRERIAAVVLAGTSAAFGKVDGAWQQRFIAERTAPLERGRAMRSLASELVPTMTAPHAADTARAAAIDVMADVPPSTYRAALKALMGFDRRASLSSIACPVLLIAGAHDRNAPVTVMQGMADRIADARLVTLDGCGHLMNLECPDAFDAALIDFVSTRVDQPDP